LWLTLFRTVLAASLLFVLVFQSSLRARAEPPGATEYVAFALLAMVFVVMPGWTHVRNAVRSCVVTGGPISLPLLGHRGCHARCSGP
jgi:hypothetical protein